MGVFDAVTRVVLEAGRVDRRGGGRGNGGDTPAAPEPRPWRFRLPYMPALAVLAALLVR